jgi:hypothetical protein
MLHHVFGKRHVAEHVGDSLTVVVDGGAAERSVPRVVDL